MAPSSPASSPKSQTQTRAPAFAEVTPGSAPVEVDEVPEQGDDGDSTFEEEMSSFTASLTSSVLNYPTQYGRRYHAYQAGCKCMLRFSRSLFELTHHSLQFSQ